MISNVFINQRLWIYCCIILICGIIIVTSVFDFASRYSKRFFKRQDIILLEPSNLILTRFINECDLLSIPLTFHNNSESNIKILETRMSCGCQSITTTNEQPLSIPFDLKPGQSLPLELTIDTCGKEGKQYLSLGFFFESEGQNKFVTSDVTFFVRPGLRLYTPPLFKDLADNDELESIFHEIIITDGFCDPGIEIESVVSSSPDKICVKLKKTENETVDLITEGIEVKKRWKIEANLLAANEGMREYITVYPKNKKYSALQIPVVVYGKTQKINEQLYPSMVVFPLSTKNIVREVRFVPNGPVDDLALISEHEGICVEVLKETNGIWLIKICIEHLLDTTTQLILGNKNGEEIIRIPVVVANVNE